MSAECSKGWRDRCPLAKGSHCTCACGGANHGIGRGDQQAPERTTSATYRGKVSRETADGRPFEVGDLVRIAAEAPAGGGELAYVYETYKDFDEAGALGISLLTESGGDTGGWSAAEQRQWVRFERASGMPYEFRNVGQLAQDFRDGRFTQAFATPAV